MSLDVPFISQYKKIKNRYKDAILFFRMGDFYEMFFDDARVGSRVLGVTLTSKRTGRSGKVPLAGIPVKAADGYIAKLVKSGHRVAICEQVEDPKDAKGLVKRDVLEVVTPGTITDDSILEGNRNNYIAAVFSSNSLEWGLSFIDLSTGEFHVTEVSEEELVDEVQRISPSELVVPESWLLQEDTEKGPETLSQLLERLPGVLRSSSPDWCFTFDDARDRITSKFETANLDGFGCQDMDNGVPAAGGLLSYLERIQPEALRMVRTIRPYSLDRHMIIDAGTFRNLEVFQSMRPDLQKATLIDALDVTCTPMGGRLLRQWLLKPLRDVDSVNARLDAVEEFFTDGNMLSEVRKTLKQMGDLERLSGKLVSRKANPRDIIALKETLKQIPSLRATIGNVSSELLSSGTEQLHGFPEAVEKIESAIVDDPPVQLAVGGVIKDSYNCELDELRELKRGGTKWIADLQAMERSRTGIATLKVGYNKVFGYYIEVTKRNLANVPDEYIRKQTLSQGERFITEELKEMEMKILSAQEKLESLESELFTCLREDLAGMIDEFKTASLAVAVVDVVSSFAQVARENRYARPAVNDGGGMYIQEGRHPVVERLILEETFIPNDLRLDADTEQIIILTGPNMAGKSTFLRQVGIIVLMAQSGSYVPASRADIGIVDRIFTRVGASDSLASGQSTFLVEMNETANILHNATERSLVLLDEIGRGTSTYDGLSIAWAVTEYLHEHGKTCPRTIFATHYHELTQLAVLLPKVRNYNVLVREWGDKVVFLRKIEAGSSDRSYGIQVARIAGIPEQVIMRAKEILANLEQGEHVEQSIPPIARGEHLPVSTRGEQLSLFESREDVYIEKLVEMIKSIDIENMRPVEAIGFLDELKKLLAEGNREENASW
jgi:DNA mismatch repair protein MutS